MLFALGIVLGAGAASLVARARRRRESTIVLYLTPFAAQSIETRRADSTRLIQEIVN